MIDIGYLFKKEGLCYNKRKGDFVKIFEILKKEEPNLLYNIDRYKQQLSDALLQTKKYGNSKEVDHILALLEKIQLPEYEVQLSFTEKNDSKNNVRTLQDDWTYTKPLSYHLYRGQEIYVKTYRDLYLSLIKFFLDKDRKKFLELLPKSRFQGVKIPYFSTSSRNMRTPVFYRGVYIETHFTANKIRDLLIDIFHYFQIDPTFLQITIRYDNKNKYQYYSR